MEFLDILLEAKGNKKTQRIKVDQKKVENDTTDYTEPENAPDSETDVDDEGNDTGTDEDDTEATDYTEEEVEVDPEADSGEENNESTDYTDDSLQDEGDTSEDGDGAETNDSTSTDEEGSDDGTEQLNQRLLLKDFINLYYLSKNTITKLSNINNSNILVNKIISQINSNLSIFKKAIFDYIVFNFEKGKYVENLYKYNYFLEAFKINVQMLKKIGVFTSN